MKVIVLKSYEKREEQYDIYGDAYEIWHGFNVYEKLYELNADELSELKRAIAYFNLKKSSEYRLVCVVVSEETELDKLLKDFKEYEKEEREKAQKLEVARLAKLEKERIKREESKANRALKKLAKEMGLTEDEVRKKLAK